MEIILLVEDNKELLDNITEILELSNFSVIRAEGGKEALEKIKEHKNKINLILCDIMMPDVDGYGVLRALENMPDMKGIPFVFMSAKSERADVRMGMNLGADDYLVKPFSSNELLSVINARLKKSLVMQDLKKVNIKEYEELIKNPSSNNLNLVFRKNSRTKRLKKKESLYIEGENVIYVYYVISGKLKSSKTNEFGKEYITNIYSQGDFMGYNALLNAAMHEDTATALEDSELNMMLKEDFIEMILGSPAFCSNFMHQISVQLSETERKLLQIAYNSARKKVAEALIYLANKYYAAEAGKISFSVSRDDLSAISGIAAESVSRNLSDFRSEKLIDIVNGNLIILDMRKLENLKN